MRYAVIYMAAGNSRRFRCPAGRKEAAGALPGVNTNKLLQEWNGKPLYQHGLDCLMDLMEQRQDIDLFVVTQYDEIAGRVRKNERIHAFVNPDSRLGISHTIKRGILEAKKTGDFDYFLFLTADQPMISRETLERFLELGDEKHYSVLSAAFGKQPGNPVMFRKELAPELLTLKEDEGGRKIWRRHSREGIMVQVESAVELKDFDFPEDFLLPFRNT